MKATACNSEYVVRYRSLKTTSVVSHTHRMLYAMANMHLNYGDDDSENV
ncbi:MAG: hypothetical protein ACOC80_13720 [Petrotogales bacterium]